MRTHLLMRFFIFTTFCSADRHRGHQIHERDLRSNAAKKKNFHIFPSPVLWLWAFMKFQGWWEHTNGHHHNHFALWLTGVSCIKSVWLHIELWGAEGHRKKAVYRETWTCSHYSTTWLLPVFSQCTDLIFSPFLSGSFPVCSFTPKDSSRGSDGL